MCLLCFCQREVGGEHVTVMHSLLSVSQFLPCSFYISIPRRTMFRPQLRRALHFDRARVAVFTPTRQLSVTRPLAADKSPSPGMSSHKTAMLN